MAFFANCADRSEPSRVFLENDIDDAGHRIRAVLSGRAVEQHFNAFDCIQGNAVQIDRLRAFGHTGRRIELRRRMTPFAVDQHQRLVGCQASKRNTFHEARRVARSRGRREAERRHGGLQRFAERSRTGLGEIGAADDLNGSCTVEHGRLSRCASQ